MSRRCWTRTYKPFATLVAALTFLLVPAGAETTAEQYRIYTGAPRLFLRPQRLRLLRRERERQSSRWAQLDALVSGGVPLREPGFALALEYAASGDKALGRRAVDWALSHPQYVRQAALVYDWCRLLLSDGERTTLAGQLRGALTGGTSVGAVRDRVLAAISLADDAPEASARALQEVIEYWWRERTAPGLRTGDVSFTQAELYPLYEIIHAIRDNLNIDLREDAAKYFKPLPLWYVASFYPAPYEASANEIEIPAWSGGGEPDLARAAMARAAGLAIVASDTNATETQYAQGFLMQDRFEMRDALGAPYEFLWANPYQPGLAYALLPPVYYDARHGALFARSSWDDDARWFGVVGGQYQLFEDGRVKLLELGASAGAPKPIEVGPAEVVQWRAGLKVDAGEETLFMVGGVAGTRYNVEVEDEELAEVDADRAGTVRVEVGSDWHPLVYVNQAGR
ncbi:MAG TPA: hypothetical protein VMJ34_12710 [Bryobacteraceae bacterium]|nr:hypothetical protein [Bryobacteraceae bacterium]